MNTNNVEEELDESMFFLELIAEFNPNFKAEIQKNWMEGNELLSIVLSSIITIRKNEQNRNIIMKIIQGNLKSKVINNFDGKLCRESSI